MDKNKMHFTAALAIATTILLATTACSSNTLVSSAAVSRAKLYSSLDALIQDSPQIFVGKVISSDVAHDEQLKMDVTLATVEVYKDSDPATEPATTVTVRQSGTSNVASDLRYMQVGKVYAIFAVTSDNTTAGKEYDIRGVDAGIYQAADSVSTADDALAARSVFTRMVVNTGDTLPATIHLSDIPGL